MTQTPPFQVDPMLWNGPRGTDRKAQRIRRAGLWAFGIFAILSVWARLPAGMVPNWLGFLALGCWLVFADKWMRRPGGIPCLTWHSVSADASWLPWARQTSVRPEILDRQLSILRRAGCRSMDTVEFVRRRRAGRPVPDDTVLLHFDDGYLDNWVAAAPILQRYGMRATLFISLDFVAPNRPPPENLATTNRPIRWDGYLSWAEIKALDRGAFGGVFDVQPHGVDHTRVPVSQAAVGELTRYNWKRHAWMQWAAMPGNKHDWYTDELPAAVPLGTPIPESEAALAARACWNGRRETGEEYAARVRRELQQCRDAFEARLGKTPGIFCWPQNRCSDTARRIAAETGYLATTAGKGANRPGENPQIISRVHVGERTAGFEWPWFDGLYFRATVRCFQGNNYWYFLIATAGFMKAAQARLARFGSAAGRRAHAAIRETEA